MADTRAEAVELLVFELSCPNSEDRQRGLAALEAADDTVAAEPAVVEAITSVICSADVSTAEYRQACYLATELMLRADGGFDLEYLREQRITRAFEAPTLVAVATKPAKDLPRDDVLTIGASAGTFNALFSKGFTRQYDRATHEPASTSEAYFFGALMTQHPLLPEPQRAAANPGVCQRLTELTLEMLHEPRGLSDRELACIWAGLTMCTTQRAELAEVAAKCGLFKIGAAELRKRSPIELVKWQSPSSFIAGAVFIACVHTAIIIPHQVTSVILDSGIVDIACAAIKAFELHGAGVVEAHEANVMVFIHIMLMLQPLDLSAPEAQPIVEQLRQIPTSLKFMMRHNLDHMKNAGMTTSALTSQICALTFGKHEKDDGDGSGERFVFTERDIDVLLVFTRDIFDGALTPWFAITPHWLKPIEALCISDANKILLVKSSALVPLLVAALFIYVDAEHVRFSVDAEVKAAVQSDAVNCFLQIAVFAPGRELLVADGGAMEALHALAVEGNDLALTPDAQLAAAGAILAIEGRTHEPQPEMIAAQHGMVGRHVMVSCECTCPLFLHQRRLSTVAALRYSHWHV